MSKTNNPIFFTENDSPIGRLCYLGKELSQVFGNKGLKCILCYVEFLTCKLFVVNSLVCVLLLTLLPSLFAQPDYSRLADAIYKAEGGSKASTPYGIHFKGCSWLNASFCRQICLKTLRNTYKRHSSSKSSLSYLEFLRDRYAPLSDNHLNINWLKNVEFYYGT